MRHLRSALTTTVLVVVATANLVAAPADTAQRQSPRSLDLDRLYSLPWLTGTQPDGARWAPDSKRLAFLWNDDGTNFRDVWMTDIRSGRPTRLTGLPRLAAPSDPGKDVEKLREVERSERDHGVSSVIWTSDGRQLIFVFHDALYSLLPGQQPRPLTDTSEPAGEPAADPRANRIAYLCGNDLCVMDP